MTVPASGLTIRIDDSATDSAKSATAEHTQQLYDLGLFRDDDLSVRLDLIAAAAGERLYEGSHPKIAASVARSLRWATVLEVGIRWLFFDLVDEQARGPIDAFGALARVIHGLAERDAMVGDPVVDQLLDTLAAIESSTDPCMTLSARLRGFVEFSRSRQWDNGSWAASTLDAALSAHPNALTAEFAARHSQQPTMTTRTAIASSCTTAQYLAFDIVAYLTHGHGKRMVTPTARLGNAASETLVAEQLSDMHSRMLDAAQTMYEQLQSAAAPASNDAAAEYVEATFSLVAIADQQLRNSRPGPVTT